MWDFLQHLTNLKQRKILQLSIIQFHYKSIPNCYKFYTRGSTAVWPSSKFGAGTGSIYLDDLACPSGARHLDQCTHRGWGSHDDSHSEDVGITCVSEGL